MTLTCISGRDYEGDVEIIKYFGHILLRLGLLFCFGGFFYTKSVHSAKFGPELEQGRGKKKKKLKVCCKTRGKSTTAGTQM